MEKEERQVTKIRELVKERNKQRAQNQRKMPPPKRRKLESNMFEPRNNEDMDKVNNKKPEMSKIALYAFLFNCLCTGSFRKNDLF